MSQSLIGGALFFIVVVILLIIFACLFYLWTKTRQLERFASRVRNQKTDTQPAESGKGSILGFSGKELYDVLKNGSDTQEHLIEIKKSYVFYLSRHLESAIEQGIIDQKQSKSTDMESEMAVGGTRGDVNSWLPLETLSKFYSFGKSLNTAMETDDEVGEAKDKLGQLLREALENLNMQSYSDRMSDLIAKKYILSA